MPPAWSERFLASTKGQIVALLRRSSRTVDELASFLGLSDNAVRAQLTSLERDGLVRQAGVRRGFRKPSYSYELAPEAEAIFRKPYALALGTLLTVATERLGPAGVEDLLRSTGERLGRELANGSGATGELAAVERAVQAVNELGGLAELEETPDRYIIRGYDCLFRSLLPEHPGVCRLAESMLATVTGAPAEEHCERSERPHCRFEILKGSTQPKVEPNGSGGEQ